MTHSPIPTATITVAIPSNTNTTSGALPLPIHPTILAFWIQYFADRIQCVIQDSTVSHFDRQEWLNEMLDDLADLASQGHYEVKATLVDHGPRRKECIARITIDFIDLDSLPSE